MIFWKVSAAAGFPNKVEPKELSPVCVPVSVIVRVDTPSVDRASNDAAVNMTGPVPTEESVSPEPEMVKLSMMNRLSHSVEKWNDMMGLPTLHLS